MADVVIIKTISGEEVIATQVTGAKAESNYTYERARILRMMPDGQGGVKAGLVPYIMVAPEAVVNLNPDLIMCIIPCPDDVEGAYLEATTGFTIARA